MGLMLVIHEWIKIAVARCELYLRCGTLRRLRDVCGKQIKTKILFMPDMMLLRRKSMTVVLRIQY